MATALVVGYMIGSGVFLLPASLASTAGPVSILAWIFTGAGAFFIDGSNYEPFAPEATWTAVSAAAPLTLWAFANSVWAIAGAGQEIIAKGFVLLLAGIPIYVGMRRWQQRDAGRTAVAPPPLSLRNGKPATTGELVAAAGQKGAGHDA